MKKEELAPTSTAVEEDKKGKPGSDYVFVGLNRAQGIIFTLKSGKTVEIAGNAVHLKGREMGVLPVGAFGLTPVLKNDWEEIQERMKDTALMRSGRLFAGKSKSDAKAEAADKKSTRHGLEPVKGKRNNAGDKPGAA